VRLHLKRKITTYSDGSISFNCVPKTRTTEKGSIKNLCEPSKKAQKAEKLALTMAKLPPLLRDDALGYLTQYERQRVLDSFEKYFTSLFHNRVALMKKYNEELNQEKRRQQRIDKTGHVLADAFHEFNVTNYWEIYRNESFNSFGLSQVHSC
jgi:hypothetical protein